MRSRIGTRITLAAFIVAAIAGMSAPSEAMWATPAKATSAIVAKKSHPVTMYAFYGGGVSTNRSGR